MDLILWRHAEAIAADENLLDAERPLTSKGQRQAKRMGEWLNRVLPENTRVLSSPALRATQTADALERRYKRVAGLSPDGTVDHLLAEARWPLSKEVVLVVGHQPMLGLTAAYLMGATQLSADEPWRLKKGAIWWMRSKTDADGRTVVTTVAVRSPELL